MFFSRYAKFMFAPDTGADGGAGIGDTVATEVDNTDYKALYEKEVAERAKLKKSFDATASEIAELKKASKAKMSEEEKREAELAEERKHWQEMSTQLNSMKVETVFAKNGFVEEDYADLAKTIVEVGGDGASRLAEILVDFVKKSNNTAVASAKNAMIKDSVITPQASTEPKTMTGVHAQRAREARKSTQNIQNIQNYYRKSN